MEFAQAMMNHNYALGQVARGASETMPTQPVTIA